jgi:hypothetical protein
MTKHYSEVELLELYYVPGASTKAFLHVAECVDCNAVYERLQMKLRGAAQVACDRVATKPAAFWSRQRESILSAIGAQRPRRIRLSVWAAAAAALILAISGASWNLQQRDLGAMTASIETRADELSAMNAALATPLLADGGSPWESDELSDLASVVAWESWIDERDQS